MTGDNIDKNHLFFNHFNKPVSNEDVAELSPVDKKRQLCDSPPKDKSRKQVILHTLLKERKQRENDYDATYILNTCLELVNDYDCCGYNKFKNNYDDEGSFYAEG